MTGNELVEGVDIGAVAGGARPLVCAFDGRALRPLVERQHELPVRVRCDHRSGVGAPAHEIARQPWSTLAPLSNPGAIMNASGARSYSGRAAEYWCQASGC